MALVPSFRWKAVGVVAVALLGGCGLVSRRFPASPGSCGGEARTIIVETDRHVLTTCENGRATSFSGIRYGWNGLGKRREGDKRTPIGRYPLGEPRASYFGTFVPIGYPTPEERHAGYTGSAVGVHGPGRGVKWLGSLVNLVDATDGCIGVATDEEAARIGAWVSEHRGATILIR
jgi:hypothetical protein